ncbi:thioredoxin domain-containing protein [Kaistia algarum]|uniref:thioredoxin domain-containing protein n=1 Tax=Kaistia algarum TaxID=2083279 RepID=UPI000CE78B86|nr:thioredoxin domain-containing protein [Kaistia algarum]MCX5513863.1 thioredoxin domain-containing protein [Kaistia algarum]PPE79280.1 thioredoxin domain-containing protein [Kaistia algarum]
MSKNLLRHETSPYLLQHRDNPVHWRAWNAAALTEAATLNRPILLSVGYAACHWCHVMAHESFEDVETAAVMNALFVNIKVDREERPDLDQIYMAALHAIGEPGGWPLTMFLTPDGKPIWGGTYFPKQARYGRPGFIDVMRRVAEVYADDPVGVTEQASCLTAHLSAPPRQDRTAQLDGALLDQAGHSLLGVMDPELGGTRGAPKFPNFPLLDFLARSAERTGRVDLTEAVDAALHGMTAGGIFDHVGGGLARYSTDPKWLVPHFEKMLSDNGLLLERLAFAVPLDEPDHLFRDRIESTIAWLERDMRLDNALFCASLDADSDGHEGAFYVWRRHDLDELLTEADAGFIAALYDISAEGNWEGVSIPNRLHPHPVLSEAEDARRRRILQTLRIARERRPHPARDDKQLTDWNAFAIAGLAAAAFRLDRSDWLALAVDAFAATGTILQLAGRPVHAHRAGRHIGPAFSSDLAALAHAALSLHRATQDTAYIDEAIRLLGLLDSHHATGDGGYFFTADDAEPLIQRRRDRQDDAAPNAHGLAADALIRLWSLTGEDRFRAEADALLAAAGGSIAANAFGAASLLAALNLRIRVRSIVIVAPNVEAAEPLRRVVAQNWRSNWTLDIRTDGATLPSDHPAHGRGAIEGRATAYLCREGSCSLPIQEPAELADQLVEG